MAVGIYTRTVPAFRATPPQYAYNDARRCCPMQLGAEFSEVETVSSRSLIATLIGAVLISACGSTTSGGGAAVAPPPASDLRTAGTLTVGSDIEYPPQEYFNPPGSNTAVGFDIDVGKALAAKMGLGFTATNDKFAAIFADLTGKKFDIVISATTITDERKKSFDFVPYFNAGESFVVPKTSSVHPTKIADLCGLTVAVEKGTTEESESMDANTKAKNGPCTSKPIGLS